MSLTAIGYGVINPTQVVFCGSDFYFYFCILIFFVRFSTFSFFIKKDVNLILKKKVKLLIQQLRFFIFLVSFIYFILKKV